MSREIAGEDNKGQYLEDYLFVSEAIFHKADKVSPRYAMAQESLRVLMLGRQKIQTEVVN